MLRSVISANLNARFPRLAENAIVRALAFSLAFHLLFVGAAEIAYRLGFLQSSLFQALSLRTLAQTEPRVLTQKKTDAPKEEIVPLIFVEVDPAQATQEAPKETKYYSARNSLAANPDTRIETEVPKLSGTQDKVPKMADRPRPVPMPLQPAPQVARNPEPAPKEPEPLKKEPEPKETPPKPKEPEPKNAPKPGDLAMAKPVERPVIKPKPSFTDDTPQVTPTHLRPRRLAEVHNQSSRLASEKMKQEGGVKRFADVEGLDAKQTPFGTYDEAIIEAIQSRWFSLLDGRNFNRNDTGKVVLTFRLNSNGMVSHMIVAESSVNDILAIICQRAVQDPSPFPKWPNDMRRLVGADYREVRFTFYYN